MYNNNTNNESSTTSAVQPTHATTPPQQQQQHHPSTHNVVVASTTLPAGGGGPTAGIVVPPSSFDAFLREHPIGESWSSDDDDGGTGGGRSSHTSTGQMNAKYRRQKSGSYASNNHSYATTVSSIKSTHINNNNNNSNKKRGSQQQQQSPPAPAGSTNTNNAIVQQKSNNSVTTIQNVYTTSNPHDATKNNHHGDDINNSSTTTTTNNDSSKHDNTHKINSHSLQSSSSSSGGGGLRAAWGAVRATVLAAASLFKSATSSSSSSSTKINTNSSNQSDNHTTKGASSSSQRNNNGGASSGGGCCGGRFRVSLRTVTVVTGGVFILLSTVICIAISIVFSLQSAQESAEQQLRAASIAAQTKVENNILKNIEKTTSVGDSFIFGLYENSVDPNFDTNNDVNSATNVNAAIITAMARVFSFDSGVNDYGVSNYRSYPFWYADTEAGDVGAVVTRVDYSSSSSSSSSAAVAGVRLRNLSSLTKVLSASRNRPTNPYDVFGSLMTLTTSSTTAWTPATAASAAPHSLLAPSARTVKSLLRLAVSFKENADTTSHNNGLYLGVTMTVPCTVQLFSYDVSPLTSYNKKSFFDSASTTGAQAAGIQRAADATTQQQQQQQQQGSSSSTAHVQFDFESETSAEKKFILNNYFNNGRKDLAVNDVWSGCAKRVNTTGILDTEDSTATNTNNNEYYCEHVAITYVFDTTSFLEKSYYNESLSSPSSSTAFQRFNNSNVIFDFFGLGDAVSGVTDPQPNKDAFLRANALHTINVKTLNGVSSGGAAGTTISYLKFVRRYVVSFDSAVLPVSATNTLTFCPPAPMSSSSSEASGTATPPEYGPSKVQWLDDPLAARYCFGADPRGTNNVVATTTTTNTSTASSLNASGSSSTTITSVASNIGHSFWYDRSLVAAQASVKTLAASASSGGNSGRFVTGVRSYFTQHPLYAYSQQGSTRFKETQQVLLFAMPLFLYTPLIAAPAAPPATTVSGATTTTATTGTTAMTTTTSPPPPTTTVVPLPSTAYQIAPCTYLYMALTIVGVMSAAISLTELSSTLAMINQEILSGVSSKGGKNALVSNDLVTLIVDGRGLLVAGAVGGQIVRPTFSVDSGDPTSSGGGRTGPYFYNASHPLAASGESYIYTAAGDECEWSRSASFAHGNSDRTLAPNMTTRSSPWLASADVRLQRVRLACRSSPFNLGTPGGNTRNTPEINAIVATVAGVVRDRLAYLSIRRTADTTSYVRSAPYPSTTSSTTSSSLLQPAQIRIERELQRFRTVVTTLPGPNQTKVSQTIEVEDAINDVIIHDAYYASIRSTTSSSASTSTTASANSNAGYLKSVTFGWRVITAIPTDVLLAGTRSGTQAMMIATGVIVTVACIFCYLLFRRLFSPLFALAEQLKLAATMKGDNLDAVLKHGSSFSSDGGGEQTNNSNTLPRRRSTLLSTTTTTSVSIDGAPLRTESDENGVDNDNSNTNDDEREKENNNKKKRHTPSILYGLLEISEINTSFLHLVRQLVNTRSLLPPAVLAALDDSNNSSSGNANSPTSSVAYSYHLNNSTSGVNFRSGGDDDSEGDPSDDETRQAVADAHTIRNLLNKAQPRHGKQIGREACSEDDDDDDGGLRDDDSEGSLHSSYTTASSATRSTLTNTTNTNTYTASCGGAGGAASEVDMLFALHGFGLPPPPPQTSSTHVYGADNSTTDGGGSDHGGGGRHASRVARRVTSAHAQRGGNNNNNHTTGGTGPNVTFDVPSSSSSAPMQSNSSHNAASFGVLSGALQAPIFYQRAAELLRLGGGNTMLAIQQKSVSILVVNLRAFHDVMMRNQPLSLVQSIAQATTNASTAAGSHHHHKGSINNNATSNSSSATSASSSVFSYAEYLDEISAAVKVRGGIVDSFMGDRVVIAFNAYKSCALHAPAAVHAADDIAVRLDEICNGSSPHTALPTTAGASATGAAGGAATGIAAATGPFMRSWKVSTTMGIASGTALVGNMGSATSRRYTTVGAVVSRAALLERLGKAFPYDPTTAATSTSTADDTKKNKTGGGNAGATIPAVAATQAQENAHFQRLLLRRQRHRIVTTRAVAADAGHVADFLLMDVAQLPGNPAPILATAGMGGGATGGIGSMMQRAAGGGGGAGNNNKAQQKNAAAQKESSNGTAAGLAARTIVATLFKVKAGPNKHTAYSAVLQRLQQQRQNNKKNRNNHNGGGGADDAVPADEWMYELEAMNKNATSTAANAAAAAAAAAVANTDGNARPSQAVTGALRHLFQPNSPPPQPEPQVSRQRRSNSNNSSSKKRSQQNKDRAQLLPHADDDHEDSLRRSSDDEELTDLSHVAALGGGGAGASARRATTVIPVGTTATKTTTTTRQHQQQQQQVPQQPQYGDHKEDAEEEDDDAIVSSAVAALNAAFTAAYDEELDAFRSVPPQYLQLHGHCTEAVAYMRYSSGAGESRNEYQSQQQQQPVPQRSSPLRDGPKEQQQHQLPVSQDNNMNHRGRPSVVSVATMDDDYVRAFESESRSGVVGGPFSPLTNTNTNALKGQQQQQPQPQRGHHNGISVVTFATGQDNGAASPAATSAPVFCGGRWLHDDNHPPQISMEQHQHEQQQQDEQDEEDAQLLASIMAKSTDCAYATLALGRLSSSADRARAVVVTVATATAIATANSDPSSPLLPPPPHVLLSAYAMPGAGAGTLFHTCFVDAVPSTALLHNPQHYANRLLLEAVSGLITATNSGNNNTTTTNNTAHGSLAPSAGGRLGGAPLPAHRVSVCGSIGSASIGSSSRPTTSGGFATTAAGGTITAVPALAALALLHSATTSTRSSTTTNRSSASGASAMPHFSQRSLAPAASAAGGGVPRSPHVAATTGATGLGGPHQGSIRSNKTGHSTLRSGLVHNKMISLTESVMEVASMAGSSASSSSSSTSSSSRASSPAHSPMAADGDRSSLFDDENGIGNGGETMSSRSNSSQRSGGSTNHRRERRREKKRVLLDGSPLQQDPQQTPPQQHVTQPPSPGQILSPPVPPNAPDHGVGRSGGFVPLGGTGQHIVSGTTACGDVPQPAGIAIATSIIGSDASSFTAPAGGSNTTPSPSHHPMHAYGGGPGPTDHHSSGQNSMIEEIINAGYTTTNLTSTVPPAGGTTGTSPMTPMSSGLGAPKMGRRAGPNNNNNNNNTINDDGGHQYFGGDAYAQPLPLVPDNNNHTNSCNNRLIHAPSTHSSTLSSVFASAKQQQSPLQPRGPPSAVGSSRRIFVAPQPQQDQQDPTTQRVTRPILIGASPPHLDSSGSFHSIRAGNTSRTTSANRAGAGRRGGGHGAGSPLYDDNINNNNNANNNGTNEATGIVQDQQRPPSSVQSSRRQLVQRIGRVLQRVNSSASTTSGSSYSGGGGAGGSFLLQHQAIVGATPSSPTSTPAGNAQNHSNVTAAPSPATSALPVAGGAGNQQAQYGRRRGGVLSPV